MRPGVHRAIVIGAVFALAAGSAVVAGDGASRKGRLDLVAFGGLSTANTLDGKPEEFGGEDVTLDIGNTGMYGLRAEGHLTDHWSLGLTLAMARPNYEAEFAGLGTASDRFAMHWIDLDATWRIRKQAATPYLLAGVGAFNIGGSSDENFTYAEQHWEGHVGAGFEWVLGKQIVCNAGARVRFSELAKFDDSLIFVQGIFGIGWRSNPPRKLRPDEY